MSARFTPAVSRPEHDLSRLPPELATQATTIARRGDLEVRLASTACDIKASQALRYRVFYEEMSAVATDETRQHKIDKDDFDEICDHLIVIDHGPANSETVIGTYRLLRQDIAEKKGRFYSEDEYDIASLVNAKRTTHRFLELGRSCVLKPYRTRAVLELLWYGIWRYVRRAKLDVMVGCASFAQIDPEKIALPLSFLHHHCAAPPQWSAKALPARYVNMNRMPKGDIEITRALKMMPPLIKGYLRLGAYIGDGAVIDEQFGTTDILVILPNSRIPARYLAHFDNIFK